jgi:hydroxymethylpyrimidine kinase/phosphomethylpyrimidine kinase/thiamine-phosphate diphosphorylase
MNQNYSHIVWTIAGSDPCSGAGAQTDLLTFADLGVHGCTVITALTAQNTRQIMAVDDCRPATVRAQISSLTQDFPPQAIKLGMIGSQENASIIADCLQNIAAPVVVDPIMIASAGMRLTREDAINTLKEKIFPRTTLLTPNIVEAKTLLNCSIKNNKDVITAAKKLLSFGIEAVLIKGGHGNGDFASDYFTDGREAFWLHSPRINQANFHGTGCLLSAAITAAIALGYELKEAVVIGKMYLNQSMREKTEFNNGVQLLSHHGWPQQQTDLPWITSESIENKRNAFVDCGQQSLGFYPIVDSAAWVKRLCELGVNTIQLRIKNAESETLESEIIQSIDTARKHQTRLFINDYWQLAIKHQAYGVHLGQEDLDKADIDAIQQAGLRLGISTHSFYEVARAHTYQPSYLAFGPIYETTSKAMAFTPRGLPALKYWRELLNYPLVAIGGIDLARLPDVLTTGVENIAVISAVTKSTDPDQTIKEFLNKIN